MADGKYLMESAKLSMAEIDLWRCPCGYVYNPMLGDPKGGIKPGIKFEDLPADWKCPSCGLPKDRFEKI